jgi:16S rRNA (cytidine1402-2'-O)-methyltransferase
MAGKLWIVSIPIGDMRDITLRAIEILRDCDFILCEDMKPAGRFLHELSLSKQLIPLNEHTESSATDEALELLRSGKNLALISDAGTPLIADPGQKLVRIAIEEGIAVSPVPGASSILAALVVSGFRSDKFFFAGFLPRDKTERKQAARKLAERSETVVLLEAPYRLAQLLDDLLAGFGPNRNACVAMELSMPMERVIRGTLLSLCDSFAAHPFKGEFVVVLEGRQSGAPKPKREKPVFFNR